MADGITTGNLQLVKPEVGSSATTWGTKLNSDLDIIDAGVTANQNAVASSGSSIGDVKMFAGATPPTNWLNCDGSALSTTSYAALFAVIGYRYGGAGATFNLPNLQGRFPICAGAGVALAQQGGGYSYPIGVANLPSHAHAIVDVAHNHGVNQTPHAHPDGGHTHGVTDTQHEHTMGGSFGYGVGGVSPPSVLNTGGAPTYTGPSGSGISIQAANANIGAQNANVSLNASGTGLTTTQPVGSGTPLNIVPFYTAVNFIIRAV